MAGPTPEELLLQIQFQCMYALGSGAQMPIDREALVVITNHTRGDMSKGFFKALFKPKGGAEPTDPGEPRWKRDRRFILLCCEAIGALAASNARGSGLVVIDKDTLMDAYNTVSTKQAAIAAQPGDYCPSFP